MAKKRYTPAPVVPREMAERLAKVMDVLGGKTTVAQAARELGLSRNHFQSILHRGIAGLAQSITPKAGGRPARPEEMKALQEENERLQRELSRLQERAQIAERVMQATSELLQGRLRPARQSRPRKATGRSDEEADSEPRLAAVETMRRCGFTAEHAARMAGVHPATARRWRSRLQQGIPGPRRRRERCIEPRARREVEVRVRALHGLIGAEALRHCVPGVSRRQAARLKVCTLQAMERERKAGLDRVAVTKPGVMRGMDAMYLQTAQGRAYALFTADAAIPYRTGVTVTSRYDAKAVVKALQRDIEAHGAPLAYRFDRAKAHQAPQVRTLLEAHGVLALHGPPHCARFYGQHERQNREHRAWLGDTRSMSMNELDSCLESMLTAVNTAWPRRALDWLTSHEAWELRPQLQIDRAQWLSDVNERLGNIKRNLQLRGAPADLAQRLAIEQALQARGLLRLTRRTGAK